METASATDKSGKITPNENSRATSEKISDIKESDENTAPTADVSIRLIVSVIASLLSRAAHTKDGRRPVSLSIQASAPRLSLKSITVASCTIGFVNVVNIH